MPVLMDLFVSIGCIIATMSVSQFFREWARDKWAKEKLGRLVLLEFVAAFEMTAVAYECSIVLGVGGLSMFAIFVFGIWYWRIQNWRDVSASPCTFIEDWFMRRIGLPSLLLAILAQLAGGLMSYRYYTLLYWRLGLTEAHTARTHEGFDECKSSINTLPLIAATVEACGIFVYIVCANLIARVKYLDGVAGLLNAFIGTSLVMYAFDTSGGYFNPVLASSIQYGCSGSTLLEHFQVYWIADTVGTFAAYYFDRFLVFTFNQGKNTIMGRTHESSQKNE